ncbi:hypothetical protein FOA43_003154 [Brettanomyces nanus]|uniref:Protein BFR2 n=1 Tax=Eeniella nana TaxID=13502 RepID=A0A875S4G2_EENNA|nr:uncharacterized protein FOA43_003154 [Brettanomyces nanus]QPG75793.1 hypothetical protein FOA43_003154 [Brettanomyces nanus]
MGRKEGTLGEEITRELVTPKNKDIDIEDVEFNDKAVESESETEGGEESDEELEKEHYVRVAKSKLRRDGVKLGREYVGERTSRSEVFGEGDGEGDVSEDDGDGDGEGDGEGEDDDDDDDVDADDADDDDVDQVDDDDDDVDADDDDVDQVDDDDDDADDDDVDADADQADEEYKRKQVGKLLEREKKQIIGRLTSSAKEDALKGYFVLQQYRLFDRILDARIKLQKALISSNQLPIDAEAYLEYKSDETDHKIGKVKKALAELTTKILIARAKLYEKDGISNVKKRKFSDYLNESEQMDTILKPYRKSILMKWSGRVQSASGSSALNAGKFKTINQNVYIQLESNMQDMDRLVKRTRMNRRRVIPLGYEKRMEESRKETEGNVDEDDVKEEEEEEEKEAYSNIDKSLQENPYIFDDDDFYRVLLNDMVDKKIGDKQSASSAAIVTLSRSKVQKNYERMATKGRKIKYTVQEPLRNFEAPISSQYRWDDDQIDQLFASLLGQKVSMAEEEEGDFQETGEADKPAEEITALRKSSLKLFG